MSRSLLQISEIFESIQGEGPSAGARCVFLRLAGCNLRCSFCDTEYSWDWQRYSKAHHVRKQPVAELARQLVTAPRLVITGGEPLLQQDRLSELLRLLPVALPIEVETNGTIVPNPGLRERVDQWNVSPKLGNSGESRSRRYNRNALFVLRDTRRAWLKLVVGGSEERREVEQCIEELAWPKERVLLQAQARDRQELALVEPLVTKLSTQLQVRYSPRLHIALWGGRAGV